jgi:hypothetical protein
MRGYPTLHICVKVQSWKVSHFDFIYIHILSYYKLFIYHNLCLSELLNSLICSFTSISFITNFYLLSFFHRWHLCYFQRELNTGLINMKCTEGKLKLRSHNASYCLMKVVTEAVLTVMLYIFSLFY